MKIIFGRVKPTDTVAEIAVGLKRRPDDYILYRVTPAFGEGYEGCRGKRAFEHRKSLGAVVISVLQ